MVSANHSARRAKHHLGNRNTCCRKWPGKVSCKSESDYWNQIVSRNCEWQKGAFRPIAGNHGGTYHGSRACSTAQFEYIRKTKKSARTFRSNNTLRYLPCSNDVTEVQISEHISGRLGDKTGHYHSHNRVWLNFPVNSCPIEENA